MWPSIAQYFCDILDLSILKGKRRKNNLYDIFIKEQKISERLKITV